MKETRPYWYHNIAYSMETYFVSLHFPNLLFIVDNRFSGYKNSNVRQTQDMKHHLQVIYHGWCHVSIREARD